MALFWPGSIPVEDSGPFKAFDTQQEIQQREDAMARAVKNVPKPFDLTAHPGYIDLTKYPKLEPSKDDDRKEKGKSRWR